jgi:FMN hydrolase / 5-amino-6-(5-phospho-D-ribitylamino)uracil phosphatase
MPIRCITFDLDDTLWDCMPVIRRAEQTFHMWLSVHYPRIAERYDHDAMVAHRKAWFARFPELHHDLTTLRKRWLALIARESGYDETLVEPAFRVFWEARNRVALYDDVTVTLERLRPRYRLGAITNGNADVHRIGIGHHFDFVVTAARVGVAKPHPEIFTAALDEAGTAAHETLHVGDDPVRDVAGAAAVGLRTLWVNPRADITPKGCTPDGVLCSVGEVVEWVESRDAG